MRRNALKEKTANMFLSYDAKARYQSKGFVFGAFMSPTHHFYNYTFFTHRQRLNSSEHQTDASALVSSLCANDAK